MTAHMGKPEASLKRALSLPLLALYGIGVTIGAGIYVLVGKVAGIAGIYAPISFLVAAILAGFTACSYAELGARYPKSAGEAIYVYEAFRRRWFATLIGLMVMITGVVSSAVVIIGFVGYLHVFVVVPDWIAITALVIVLAALAAWGIMESVLVAALLTVAELGGLLLVVWVGAPFLADVPARLGEMWPPPDAVVWGNILSGALLAFFAFIGFEDMANVAEEVKEPEVNLPRGVFITIIVTSLLYLLIALISVSAIPVDRLSASEAPLALVYQTVTGRVPVLISLIAVFAVLNGALIQMIMASRILYGTARAGWLPAILGYVDPRRRTPTVATAVIAVAILVLALWMPIVDLARFTSYVILMAFTAVNAALLVIRLRESARPAGGVRFPIWVPAVGAVVCPALALFNLMGGVAA